VHEICNQPTLSDAAFVHLTGIHTLYIYGCNQSTVTDAAFVHLAGIPTLNMSLCYPSMVAAAKARGLPVTCSDVLGGEDDTS
jgi:hypothetical protein